MPNIDGPREAKRRLVASMVHSKLLYAAPVWAEALQNHAILRILFSAQRGVALRIPSAYRTVWTSAVLVLMSVPRIDLLWKERQETFQPRKELTCISNLQEIACSKEAIRKAEMQRLLKRWQTRWHGEQTGRWTYRLILELATGIRESMGRSAFTWRKRSQAMAVSTCTWGVSRRETRRRVNFAIPLWIIRNCNAILNL